MQKLMTNYKAQEGMNNGFSIIHSLLILIVILGKTKCVAVLGRYLLVITLLK